MTYQYPLWEIVFTVLAANLGSEHYREREAAHVALRQLAPVAVERLQALEKSTDREVATRVRQILDGYYAANAPAWANETLPTNYARLPWISELPSDVEQGLAQYYLERARQQIGIHGPPEWNDYRLATKLLVEDLYGKRVTRRQVVIILDQMVETERSWVDNFGQRYYPAVDFAAKKKD